MLWSPFTFVHNFFNLIFSIITFLLMKYLFLKVFEILHHTSLFRIEFLNQLGIALDWKASTDIPYISGDVSEMHYFFDIVFANDIGVAFVFQREVPHFRWRIFILQCLDLQFFACIIGRWTTSLLSMHHISVIFHQGK